MFEVKETDILVIGGGGAGIRAAITAAELGKKVILLSKGPLSRSGITPMAGEGVEGAVNEGDSSAHHYQDTIKAGRGLADQNLVYALAQDAVDRIHDLEAYGARFKKIRMVLLPPPYVLDKPIPAIFSLSGEVMVWPLVCCVKWPPCLTFSFWRTEWPSNFFCRMEGWPEQFTSIYGPVKSMESRPAPRLSLPVGMKSYGPLPTLRRIPPAKG